MPVEYRDITVPFGGQFSKLEPGTRSWDAMFPIADAIILSALNTAAADGWEPEGLTDYHYLLQINRVATEQHGNRYSFLSATIRFRRQR
jgi:hypothetical protein